MNFKYILNEFKKGIKETSKYFLSHHKREDYYKCYILNFKKNQIALCSRCLGIYIGIIIGITLFYLQIYNRNFYYFSIAFFPIFTIIDYSISNFTKYKSNNFFRTSSGILLGVAYALSLILFFKTFLNYFIIIIGLIYLIIALILILKTH